jgi:hypothetical protein
VRAPGGGEGTGLTKRVVTMTTRQQPTNATHWSTRTMATAVAISEGGVRRISRAHGLNRIAWILSRLATIQRSRRNWKTSSACTSARRSTRWWRGRGTTLTHGYKRNGTDTLFTTLNAANGEVFGLYQERGFRRRAGKTLSQQVKVAHPLMLCAIAAAKKKEE